jgi:hypothetical protein
MRQPESIRRRDTGHFHLESAKINHCIKHNLVIIIKYVPIHKIIMASRKISAMPTVNLSGCPQSPTMYCYRDIVLKSG